jgi:hypothetical protein
MRGLDRWGVERRPQTNARTPGPTLRTAESPRSRCPRCLDRLLDLSEFMAGVGSCCRTQGSRRGIPLAARPAPSAQVRAKLRVGTSRDERLAALDAWAAAHTSPGAKRSSPDSVRATPEPPRCGTRGTTTTTRSASSNSAETRPKDPFSRTSSSVFTPSSAINQSPEPHKLSQKQGFYTATTFFSHGGRRGCADRWCWWEASPPPLGGKAARARRRREAGKRRQAQAVRRPVNQRVEASVSLLDFSAWPRAGVTVRSRLSRCFMRSSAACWRNCRAEHEPSAYYEASSCFSPIHGVKLRLSASL